MNTLLGACLRCGIAVFATPFGKGHGSPYIPFRHHPIVAASRSAAKDIPAIDIPVSVSRTPSPRSEGPRIKGAAPASSTDGSAPPRGHRPTARRQPSGEVAR